MAEKVLPKARIVIQQCLSATLKIHDSDHGKECIKIGRGIIFFVSFFQGANQDVIPKIAKSVLNVRLSEGSDGKLISVLDLPGDVLIIPQACMGGKMKGTTVQYHQLATKEIGAQLYSELVEQCRTLMNENEKCKENNSQLKHGIYGHRQVLSMETNGPFTHVFDIL